MFLKLYTLQCTYTIRVFLIKVPTVPNKTERILQSELESIWNIVYMYCLVVVCNIHKPVADVSAVPMLVMFIG